MEREGEEGEGEVEASLVVVKVHPLHTNLRCPPEDMQGGSRERNYLPSSVEGRRSGNTSFTARRHTHPSTGVAASECCRLPINTAYTMSRESRGSPTLCAIKAKQQISHRKLHGEAHPHDRWRAACLNNAAIRGRLGANQAYSWRW